MLGRVFGNLYGVIGIAAGCPACSVVAYRSHFAAPDLIIAGTGGLLATLATALVLRACDEST